MLAVAEEVEQGTLDEDTAWRQFELAVRDQNDELSSAAEAKEA